MPRKSIWKNGSPTRRINNKLRRYEKILNAEMFSAVRRSTELTRDTAVHNVFVARTVGASDSHTGRAIKGKGSSRRTVTRKTFKAELRGEIRVKPYYTGARTRAIKSILTKYGKRDLLTRKGLKVRRPWLKQKRARFVSFDDKGLKKWAIKRAAIGTQKVRLTDGRLVRDILLRPSLKRAEPFMRRVFESAFIRTGLRLKR